MPYGLACFLTWVNVFRLLSGADYQPDCATLAEVLHFWSRGTHLDPLNTIRLQGQATVLDARPAVLLLPVMADPRLPDSWGAWEMVRSIVVMQEGAVSDIWPGDVPPAAAEWATDEDVALAVGAFNTMLPYLLGLRAGPEQQPDRFRDAQRIPPLDVRAATGRRAVNPDAVRANFLQEDFNARLEARCIQGPKSVYIGSIPPLQPPPAGSQYRLYRGVTAHALLMMCRSLNTLVYRHTGGCSVAFCACGDGSEQPADGGTDYDESFSGSEWAHSST